MVKNIPLKSGSAIKAEPAIQIPLGSPISPSEESTGGWDPALSGTLSPHFAIFRGFHRSIRRRRRPNMRNARAHSSGDEGLTYLPVPSLRQVNFFTRGTMETYQWKCGAAFSCGPSERTSERANDDLPTDDRDADDL